MIQILAQKMFEILCLNLDVIHFCILFKYSIYSSLFPLIFVSFIFPCQANVLFIKNARREDSRRYLISSCFLYYLPRLAPPWRSELFLGNSPDVKEMSPVNNVTFPIPILFSPWTSLFLLWTGKPDVLQENDPLTNFRCRWSSSFQIITHEKTTSFLYYLTKERLSQKT